MYDRFRNMFSPEIGSETGLKIGFKIGSGRTALCDEATGAAGIAALYSDTVSFLFL